LKNQNPIGQEAPNNRGLKEELKGGTKIVELIRGGRNDWRGGDKRKKKNLRSNRRRVTTIQEKQDEEVDAEM